MTEDSPLSDRELEILSLVATGASNKEIAAELFISVNTVKVHLRNIYGKLDVSSRTEATIYAVREGLVPSPRSEAEPEAVPVMEGAPAPDVVPSNVTGWARWGKWAAFAAILAVLLLTAGLVGAQWTKTQIPTAVPAAVDLQTLEQDRWQERAPMLTARAGFAASVFDNQIYAMGGETPDGLTASAERYDVAADVWSPIAAMPEPLVDIQGATVGGEIYVPGGRRPDDSVSDHLLVYDPRTDSWSERAPMPVPLSAYALVAFEGKLYLFGGWDGERYTDTALRYDPSLDEWESLPPLPTARGYAGAAVSGGKIHVIGGFDGERALDVHEVYTLDVNEPFAWELLLPLPVSRYRLSCASVAEIIHLLGGTGYPADTLTYSYRYLSSEDAWDRFVMPLSNWSGLGTGVLGEDVYMFGGQLNGTYTGQCYAYQAIYSVVIPVLP